tara:strand:- start:387 stop:617 length:231 start_codon:yes stop_codon:yes gene_type:complete
MNHNIPLTWDILNTIGSKKTNITNQLFTKSNYISKMKYKDFAYIVFFFIFLVLIAIYRSNVYKNNTDEDNKPWYSY